MLMMMIVVTMRKMYGDDDNDADDNEAQVDGGDIREIKIHVYDISANGKRQLRISQNRK